MTETKLILPAENPGTEITRFNAFKHGILSLYTVLPWEDTDEYNALVEALAAEHLPEGPTEEHLVEELAAIFWRKRRLRLAEAAAHRRGLEDTFSTYRETSKAALAYVGASDQSEDVADAIRATVTDTEEEKIDIASDEVMTRRALDLLSTKRNDAYEAALAALREDTQEWWADMLARSADELEEGEDPSTADAEGLRHFLEGCSRGLRRGANNWRTGRRSASRSKGSKKGRPLKTQPVVEKSALRLRLWQSAALESYCSVKFAGKFSFCWSILAALFGQGKTTARGQSRKVCMTIQKIRS
jgi:hypothetical protein